MNLLKTITVAVIFLTCASSQPYIDDDYDSGEGSEEVLPGSCSSETCRPPNCTCFGTTPPGGLDVETVPQFVMLTFDDAINVANAETYFKILRGRKNKANQCPIAMTFFVCHEYNDYNITNVLYKRGNEIAVHSITHEANTDKWKTSGKDRWRDEMVGMRQILSKFGGIPEATISGHRAPFLQTAGSVTFEMLRENNFLYDSSMPTRNFMDPPIWPYTLDYGYRQDCQIRPCPKSPFKGLWVVPMVQHKRTSVQQGKKITFHCSMTDACTPYPETPEDTTSFLMDNFDRHYKSNKAPFPLFLHESWLRSKPRFQGYIDFLDDILNRDDVFLVTIQEVIEYMQNPIPLAEYKEKSCRGQRKPKAGDCSHPKNCHYPVRNRFMHSCADCPRRYPWLGNPQGEKKGRKD